VSDFSGSCGAIRKEVTIVNSLTVQDPVELAGNGVI